MQKNIIIGLLTLCLYGSLIAAAPSPQTEGESPSKGQDYIVQADDWLSKVADKFLGDVLTYPAITYYTNQKHALDDSYAQITDSNVIELGVKLYIPSQAEAEAYFAEAVETITANTAPLVNSSELTLSNEIVVTDSLELSPTVALTETMVAEAEVPQGEPLRIGALVPLSPPGSVSGGQAMRAALEIGLAEINANGGVLGQPVELVLLDTEGLAERGSTTMQQLAEEGVVGVVGVYHSAVGLTAKEVAHTKKLPTIFAETWNDDITASQYPEVFRIAPLSSEVAAVDANFIQSLGAEYVVIVTENTSYGIPAAESTTEYLAERNIASDTYFTNIEATDFSSTLERIKTGLRPDVILVLITGDNSFLFQQQAAEAGLGPQNVTMICNQAAADSEAFWAAMPDGKLCLYRRVGLPTALYTEVTRQFAATYQEATGKSEPESFAMEAYDSLMLMAQAINEAQSTEPTAIITALESINYQGALGSITFPYGTTSPIPQGVSPKWWHQFPDAAVTMVQYTEVGQQAIEAVVVYPEQFKTGEIIRPE